MSRTESEGTRLGPRAVQYAWVGLALWATVAIGAGLLPGRNDVRLGALGLMFVLTLVAAAVAVFAAARYATGSDHRVWLVAALSLVVMGAATIPWVFSAGPRLDPVLWQGSAASRLGTVGWIGVTLAVAWGAAFAWVLLAVSPLPRSDRALRWHWVLDGLLAAAGAYLLAILAGGFLGPTVSLSPVIRSVGAVIIAEGGTLTICAGLVCWSLRRGPGSRLFLAAAAGVIAIGAMLTPFWLASRMGLGEPFVAEVVEVVWLLGPGIVFVAAVQRLAEPRPTPWLSNDTLPGTGRLVSIVAVSSGLTFVTGLAAWVGVAAAWPLQDRRLAMAGALILAAASVTRGVMSVLDREEFSDLLRADPLTGLNNARHFRERLADEFGAARSAGDPLTVGSMDLDDFAGVNVTCGRATADEVLSDIGSVLHAEQGPDLLIARTGGDEFGLLMPGVPRSAAAARVRELLQLVSVTGAVACRTTASAGLAEISDSDADAEALAERADRALYWAKYRGKDAVAIWDGRLMGERFDRQRERLAERRELLALVRSLAAVNDDRIATRHGHSRAVADLAVRLSRAMELEEERVGAIETAALLHDIGIVCVPDQVLDQSGSLSAADRELLEEHPTVGARIVSGTELAPLAPWIEAHHERWDGSGYPKGLAGQDIPFEARVIALCDTFEGSTSRRPHHAARDWRNGVAAISAGMGTDFDPVLAERFISLLVAEGAQS